MAVVTKVYIFSKKKKIKFLENKSNMDNIKLIYTLTILHSLLVRLCLIYILYYRWFRMETCRDKR